MKNSKYKEGALRVIVSEDGKQLLATPDGVRFPRQIWTDVRQSTEQAMEGTCRVYCEIFIKTPDYEMDDPVEVDGSGLRYAGITYPVRVIQVEPRTDDNAASVKIDCIAYPDTTT